MDSMKYFEVIVYLKHRHNALCSMIFENKQGCDKFIDELNLLEPTMIKIGDYIVNKKEVRYARIKERTVK